MSTNVISAAECSELSRRPVVDVLVERLARRMLRWSERPVRQVGSVDQRRLRALADARSVATAHPVRWY
ncbi:MAG TPA: hypothetical protein VHX87_02480 [Galbitalea sp.]|jgi:hypothetical protein|nr:hypothetical protein [Galbitalea sp.]